jgi:hypothetical protein
MLCHNTVKHNLRDFMNKLSSIILQLNSQSVRFTPQSSAAQGYVYHSTHNKSGKHVNIVNVWEDVLYASDTHTYNKLCYGIYSEDKEYTEYTDIFYN